MGEPIARLRAATYVRSVGRLEVSSAIGSCTGPRVPSPLSCHWKAPSEFELRTNTPPLDSTPRTPALDLSACCRVGGVDRASRNARGSHERARDETDEARLAFLCVGGRGRGRGWWVPESGGGSVTSQPVNNHGVLHVDCRTGVVERARVGMRRNGRARGYG